MDRKKGLIITLLVGMAIGELLPEPTDALLFYLLDWLECQPKDINYYLILFFAIYCLSALWYLFLLMYFLIADIKPEKSMFYFIGLISLGGVLGVVVAIFTYGLTFIEVIAMVFVIAIISFIIIFVVNYYSKNKRRRI